MRPEKDMFQSGCQVLVNPVNCVGAAGKGLALQFKARFPKTIRKYISDCRNHRLYKPGACVMEKENGTIIANLATENHYKDGAKPQYIAKALRNLRFQMEAAGYTSVAIPRIGCGLGGLNWADIRPLILEEPAYAPFTIWLDGEIIPPNPKKSPSAPSKA